MRGNGCGMFWHIRIVLKHFDKMMERLLSSMQGAGGAGLLIQKGNESHIIPFEDIVFCEIIDRKVYVFVA